MSTVDSKIQEKHYKYCPTSNNAYLINTDNNQINVVGFNAVIELAQPPQRGRLHYIFKFSTPRSKSFSFDLSQSQKVAIFSHTIQNPEQILVKKNLNFWFKELQLAVSFNLFFIFDKKKKTNTTNSKASFNLPFRLQYY